jgi:hypothetical protein
MVLAKADPEPAPAAAQREDRPLYQRVLGGVFGGSAEASKAPEPAPSTTAAPAPVAASPLPPRRRSVSAAPGKDQPATPVSAAKPQAAKPKPERHVSAAGYLPATPAGPMPGGFARN